MNITVGGRRFFSSEEIREERKRLRQLVKDYHAELESLIRDQINAETADVTDWRKLQEIVVEEMKVWDKIRRATERGLKLKVKENMYDDTKEPA